MDAVEQILCTLIIPSKFYLELTDDVKELFIQDDGYYSAQFPADTTEDTYLGEYIKAFCEVALIINNPKYEITEACELSSELLKFGQSEESYSLLITIKYPGSDKEYNDVLFFKEISQSLGYYTFELLGDQTLFAID